MSDFSTSRQGKQIEEKKEAKEDEHGTSIVNRACQAVICQSTPRMASLHSIGNTHAGFLIWYEGAGGQKNQ